MASTNFTACSAPVTLTPSGTPGGTFSGPGVVGTTFNPALAGVGTHNITYFVSAQQGAAVAAASDSFSIAVTVTNFSLNSTSTAATCAAPNGSASVSVTGGTAPFSYNWSNSANTATANNITAGTYTVTVTDASGCSNIDTVFVAANSTTITGSTASTNAGCGANDGTATATATNGTAPYTYLWSNGGQTAQVATNLAAGNYNVTVTDANGCAGVLSATVNNSNSPTASIQSSSNVACNGGNNGTATVTPAGGTSPYSFIWSAAAQTTQMASGLSAGVYNVTVQDAASCIATSTVTITEPTAIAVNINTATTTDVSCKGGANGIAGVIASGGTGGFSYIWNTGASTQDITGLLAAVYTVTVTDANSCTSAQNLNITEPTAIIANASGVNITCNGLNNGSASVASSGGISPYTYSWSNAANTASITGLVAGAYSVVITDANGCTVSSNGVTITEPAAITSGITATDPSSAGGFNGNINIAPTGGTAPYTYNWSNGASIQNLSNISAGTYSVTITDANACTFTTSATLNDGPTAVSFTAFGGKVAVFPNPAQQFAIVNIESANAVDVNIQVTNLMGQLLYNHNANNVVQEAYTLDLSQWAAAVYFVRVTIGEEVIIQRLVKE